MKLAEALLIRADLQKKLEQLQHRLVNNASVQQGQAPAEEPGALLAQLDTTLAELERLIAAINHTNAQVKNAAGETMTTLLARRDCLKWQQSAMRDMLSHATFPAHRTRASEILFVSTIPVAKLQKQVDDQAAALRRLELDIQALNWTSELIEE